MPGKYQLRKTIEDEVIAPTHYDAFVQFRKRSEGGYYGIRQEDVELIEEVAETPPSTPEEE